MKNMPEMKDTHHLMVFVKDAQGGPVKTAKVGYLIQDAAGAVQKKMTMAMNDGFGADVTFEPGKHYQIKTKVMAGTTTLMDEFEYMGGSH
jgi:ABC-type sulfate/molybdate transport systems ATPase subunit